MNNKVVLIDFSSIARPIFESTSDASQCHVKMVERVRALASAHKHVALCCDSGRTFRHEIDASYKAQRAETPAVYLHQCALALDTLRADGFPVWEAKGFEADDIIATAVEQGADYHAGPPGRDDGPYPVLIISADKDLRQLVSDRVEVFAPSNGAYESKTYDVAAVKEKHGVNPDQMLDYLALLGDKSDNIVGAKGIGEVTAAKLLNQFGNIDDMYAAMDKGPVEISPAGFKSLMEFRSRLEIVRGLLTLRTDVPIPFEDIFKERVPQDVAVFGDAEDDIAFAMPTLISPDAQKDYDEEVAAIRRESDVKPMNYPPQVPLTPEQQQAVYQQTVEHMPPTPAAHPAANAPTQSTAIVRQAEVVADPPAEWERQLEPRSMKQAIEIADKLHSSRLEFGKGYGNGAAVLSTIIAGREMGLPAMASLRAFHIIDNKPTLSAGVIHAMILRSGLAEYFRCSERSNESATFVTKRKGEPEQKLTFTIADAKMAWTKEPAKFALSGWGKNPADMLVARASSKLARLVYPDVVFGTYSPEDFDEQR